MKSAIHNLTTAERVELLAELPQIFPELDGDAAWESIIRAERPRPAVSDLLNDVEATHQRDRAAFKETSDAEFDRYQ